jgi:hypothetical protein
MPVVCTWRQGRKGWDHRGCAVPQVAAAEYAALAARNWRWEDLLPGVVAAVGAAAPALFPHKCWRTRRSSRGPSWDSPDPTRPRTSMCCVGRGKRRRQAALRADRNRPPGDEPQGWRGGQAGVSLSTILNIRQNS